MCCCFKQKTAYEMRISDWSSDVCSSDLTHPTHHGVLMWGLQRALAPHTDLAGALIEFCCDPDEFANSPDPDTRTTMWERWLYASGAGHSADGRMVMRYLREAASPKIGSASGRGRVCQCG